MNVEIVVAVQGVEPLIDIRFEALDLDAKVLRLHTRHDDFLDVRVWRG